MKPGRKGRKRILPDRLFYKLWTDAEKFEDKKEFIAKYTSPGSSSYIEFKRKYGMEYEEGLALLNEIYVKQHMSFKELLEVTGKRKADISNTFCIPIRTVEDWYAETNKCSSYIRLMIIRQYHLLRLGKYIYLESEVEYFDNKPGVYKKNAKVTSVDDIDAQLENDIDEDDKLLEIDDYLESLRRRRRERESYDDSDIKTLLDKTSFIDGMFKR